MAIFAAKGYRSVFSLHDLARCRLAAAVFVAYGHHVRLHLFDYSAFGVVFIVERDERLKTGSLVPAWVGRFKVVFTFAFRRQYQDECADSKNQPNEHDEF